MSEPGLLVSQEDFRSLMATFPSGVTVVTAVGSDGLPRGMTCSSLCSVSLDPPTLLVSLRQGQTAAAVLAGGAFTVNLLHEGSRETAELFARPAGERFSQVRWRSGPVGAWLVEDAHRVADCVVVRTCEVGDHVVVFGEVRSQVVFGDRHPLLYGQRNYGRWSQAVGPLRIKNNGAGAV